MNLSEKIQVMQSALAGKPIEYKRPWCQYWKLLQLTAEDIGWDWEMYEYRVAPDDAQWWRGLPQYNRAGEVVK